MDLISVIIPIYKVETYLEKCIESVVCQTYSNLEIILVDDGSPDGCPSICDAWAEKDSRIIVIHKENGGLSDARNAGLNAASGKYISFVDSDDWLKKNFLETLFNLLQHENADIAECGVVYTDEKGHELRTRGYAGSHMTMDKLQALRALVKEEGIYQTVWNKLYKKRVLEGIFFEYDRCNEDDFWTYQVFDRIEKLSVTPEPLYCYLQRRTSIMGNGYSLKRLDGLEGRLRRMAFLQKYEETAVFTKAYIQYDCMYHFQSALKWLNGAEQKAVTDYIIDHMKELGDISYIDSGISVKYQIWFLLFRKFPFAIAMLRNLIGIGL